MARIPATDNLEAARSRLEAAMSRLAHGVAASRSALDTASVTAQENTVLKTQITALEQENLKLHEQVARLALADTSNKNEEYESLAREKAALEQNYTMLKNRYAALQDEFEALQQTSSPADGTESAFADENTALKQKIAAMTKDRDTVRAELDKAIADLEAMLEKA